MQKPLKIDDVDFSSYFTEIGYSVFYQPVTGPNSGQMIDGTFTEDELKLNAVVKLPCYPLTEDQLSDVLTAVLDGPYHMVYYYDPKIKATRTMEARRAVTEQKYRGRGPTGDEYWTGTVITFTER